MLLGQSQVKNLGLGHGDVIGQIHGGGQAQQDSGKHPGDDRLCRQPDGGGGDAIAPANQSRALLADAEQEENLQDDGGDGTAVVQPLPAVYDLGAEDGENGVHFGQGDEVAPDGDGVDQCLGNDARLEPVSGQFLSGGGEGGAQSGAQGEQQREVYGGGQGGQRPVQRGAGELRQNRGGSQHVKHRVPEQQYAADEPAQLEPSVFLAQGAVAQIEQNGAQQGKNIVEIEEIQLKEGQHHAPQNFGDGGVQGIGGGDDVLGGGDGRQIIHQDAVKFLLLHSASPPNSLRSFLRMRYRRPSTARSEVDSSAAIRWVDCK